MKTNSIKVYDLDLTSNEADVIYYSDAGVADLVIELEDLIDAAHKGINIEFDEDCDALGFWELMGANI